jgi:hypothetical protein
MPYGDFSALYCRQVKYFFASKVGLSIALSATPVSDRNPDKTFNLAVYFGVS